MSQMHCSIASYLSRNASSRAAKTFSNSASSRDRLFVGSFVVSITISDFFIGDALGLEGSFGVGITTAATLVGRFLRQTDCFGTATIASDPASLLSSPLTLDTGWFACRSAHKPHHQIMLQLFVEFLECLASVF